MVGVLFAEIKKFNPYHGSDGKFTTGSAATSFTIKTKDPKKRWMVADAKSKERTRVRTQSLHQIEDKIRNQPHESAAVVDKNGDALFFKDGEKAQVVFTPDETAKMKGNSLTHNHPRGSILSIPDVGTMVGADLEEIRATTSEGRTYSLKRGKKYTDSQGVDFFNEFSKQTANAQGKASDALDAKGYQEKIRSGAVTQEQADREMTQIITEYMTDWLKGNASKYGLDFSVEEKEAA